ncbi:MAG: TRAP transporter permease [Sedimentibacter sp.]
MNKEVTESNDDITTLHAGEKSEDILKKYSKEENVRKLNKSTEIVVNIIAFVLGVFLIYTSAFGTLPALRQRSVYLTLVMAMLFLIYPAYGNKRDKGVAWYDYLFSIVAAISCFYVVIQYESILMRMGISNSIDRVMGVCLIILILEGTRRLVSPALAFITLLFLLYALFGNYIPGIFHIRSGGLSRLIDHQFMIPEGIFGTPMAAAATYVSLFVIFSSLLQASGMGEFIQDMAMALAGHKVGGPAKVAVIGSSIFGTVSGEAVANVVGTGTFTIPLMKKTGYEPTFAGAVEACASTGGQLVPPVMGAACFVMAEYIGVGYSKIMLAGIIPAFLYYFSTFVAVHLRAERLGLKGLEKSQLPDGKKAFKERGHLIIPFLAVIIMILMQFTISYAALVGIILILIVANFKKTTRMSPKLVLESIIDGSKKTISFGVACACIGLIIGVTTLTGVGNVLGDYIITISQGNLLISLILIMIVSIFLGMGMPTVAVYIVLATVAAPVLIKLGVPLLAAHFYCFYFGIMANLTPPVAIPAYAAAAIADANPSKTGWAAFKIALPSFLIPYVFIYSPSILFIDTNIVELLMSLVTCIVGIFMIAMGFERYSFNHQMSKLKSIITLIGGILMIVPNLVADVIAVIILFIVLVTECKYNKEEKEMLCNDQIIIGKEE